MTATADPTDVTPKKKRSKLPLLIGVVPAILGGAGGFLAVRMGFLFGAETHAEAEEAVIRHTIAPTAFVPLDALIINLRDESRQRFLRFAAQVEVAPEYLTEVEAIKPRIVDVLNSYLRAVEVSDLEDPTALIGLRAQMLRRVQVVAGPGQVRNLLIMEFVLN